MKVFFLSILGLYSLILMGIEVQTSQDYVRHYFTDITGPVIFYAVNTSLSVSLQWSTALIFGVCILTLNNRSFANEKFIFYVSQVLMFSVIAFDDRFQVHERLGYLFGIDGAEFLLLLGFAEIYLLLKYGEFFKMSKSKQTKIYTAAVLFAFMIIFDTVWPQDMVLRLSIEDLCKTWGSFFLAWFAWEICAGNIDALKVRDVQAEVI